MDMRWIVRKVADLISRGVIPGMGHPVLYVSSNGQALVFFAKHLNEPYKPFYFLRGLPASDSGGQAIDVVVSVLLGTPPEDFDPVAVAQWNEAPPPEYHGFLEILTHAEKSVLAYSTGCRIGTGEDERPALKQIMAIWADAYLPPMLEAVCEPPLGIAQDIIGRLGAIQLTW